ncbi:hypothetical protein BX616_009227, partial [Lobosporangium transversale]
SSNSIQCVTCHEEFNSVSQLRNHKRDAHPGKVLVSVADAFGNVTRVDLGPVNCDFTCPVCKEGGIRPGQGIIKHTDSHLTNASCTEGTNNQCFICGVSFKTAQELDKHYGDDHSEFEKASVDNEKYDNNNARA